MEYSLDKPIDNKSQDLLHRNEFVKCFFSVVLSIEKLLLELSMISSILIYLWYEL